jgi:hypothetical protein
MNRLTRDQILASAIAPELVDLPVLGGIVGIRVLSVAERDVFDRRVVEAASDQGILRAELLSRCLMAEDGTRIFADGDFEALKALPAVALEPAFAVALRLNGLRAEDLDALGKGSAATPAAGSSSSSPVSSG